MPTVARILEIAPMACVLAANDVAKGTLFGGKLDPSTPLKIYNVYKVLKHVYDKEPNYDGLQVRADYLYELLKKYALRAAAIVDGGGGGSVAPSIPISNIFPIYITQADFTSATFYPNENISGNNVIIFLNEINRYLIPNSEFTVSATGITITLDGFNATMFTYNLIIERYNN